MGRKKKRKSKWPKVVVPDFVATEDDRPRPMVPLSGEELDAAIDEERKKIRPVEEDPGRKWWDEQRRIHMGKTGR